MAPVLVPALLALASGTASGASEDRTVTKVVKLLQGMLDKSKADGDLDRTLYAKFLCYCNSKKAAKTKEIADLTQVIVLLQNQIAELKGSTGELSSSIAELKAAMEANTAQQGQLTQLRTDEHNAYLAMKADSELAISQMTGALDTLAEVGADQTMGAAADHSQFMAKTAASALQTQTARRLRDALSVAAAYITTDKVKSVQAFIQAPFTGTYTAQSGEVVGILKQMRDTFTQNLEQATATEDASKVAYDKIMAAHQQSFNDMKALSDEKKALMGENDNALSAAVTNLADAQTEKGIREDFMSELIPMCNEKAERYEQRNIMRANEDAAITEAISILDKDSAFATFGKVDATSTGATGLTFFLQTASRSIQRHSQEESEASLRMRVEELLQKAGRKQHSLRLVKIVALLQSGNPFTAVLEAIEKLIGLIAEEGTADKNNFDWCNSERTTNDNRISELDTEISGLLNVISTLTNEIEAPETGLKARIEADEVSLKENYHSQESQTAQRQEENKAYQADIKNLVEAQDLLDAATNVLSKYYEQIDTTAVAPAAPVVMSGDTDAVPETHEDAGHQGQATAGNQVITMLKYIRDNTHAEETAAHTAEHTSQHAFEDSMAQLKSEEATLQASLASLQETLAETEKQLNERQAELKAAEDEHSAVNAYLLSIKAGCDFITENLSYRDGRRASESAALQNAINLIKGTPVYQTAVAEAHLDSLGECRDRCVEHGEEHVICKACLAKVEIPGYCAGHPGTEGC